MSRDAQRGFCFNLRLCTFWLVFLSEGRVVWVPESTSLAWGPYQVWKKEQEGRGRKERRNRAEQNSNLVDADTSHTRDTNYARDTNYGDTEVRLELGS